MECRTDRSAGLTAGRATSSATDPLEFPQPIVGVRAARAGPPQANANAQPHSASPKRSRGGGGGGASAERRSPTLAENRARIVRTYLREAADSAALLEPPFSPYNSPLAKRVSTDLRAPLLPYNPQLASLRRTKFSTLRVQDCVRLVSHVDRARRRPALGLGARPAITRGRPSPCRLIFLFWRGRIF